MINHPCEHLSEWLHRLLAPALSREFVPDFLQDTADFLREFEKVRNGTWEAPPNCGPVTAESNAFCLDVVSLYTNIPWERGVETLARLWNKLKNCRFPDHPVEDHHVRNAALFILTHAFFLFGEHMFRQIFGTAMGANYAPVFATGFMGEFNTEFFRDTAGWLELIPFWRRMLDDIVGMWNGTRQEFDAFVASLNAWSLANGWAIQFEISGFGKRVAFLDNYGNLL